MPGKIKVQVSGAQAGRVRVLRQVIQPGGVWEGGTEVTNEVDQKKGFETDISPNERIVIEEIK
jgi:hypothetical protein